MGGGGGKGGETVTENVQQIDPQLQKGAKSVLAGALRSASLGYRPNRGISVAAFSPQQQAAFQGADQAAAAFGLPVGQSPSGGYLPPEQVAASGARGYSTGAMLDENVAKSMTQQDLADRQAILMQYGKDAQGISGGPTPQNKFYQTGAGIRNGADYLQQLQSGGGGK